MEALGAITAHGVDPFVILAGAAIGWWSYPRWSLLVMLSFIVGVLMELATVWARFYLGDRFGVAGLDYAFMAIAIFLWALFLFVVRSLRKSPAAPRT